MRQDLLLMVVAIVLENSPENEWMRPFGMRQCRN